METTASVSILNKAAASGGSKVTMKLCNPLTLATCIALFCSTVSIGAPATQPSQATELEQLMARARAYNASVGEMNGWLMNCEHCFLAGSADDPSDLLYDKVISFVREPGALDLLFARLLKPKISDDDVLVLSEFLVYAGEFNEGPAERLPDSVLSPQVLKALQDGIFNKAQRKFPKAPLLQKIAFAVHRAIGQTQATTQKAEHGTGT